MSPCSEFPKVGVVLRIPDMPPDFELQADLNCLILSNEHGWELKDDYEVQLL